MYKMKEIRRAIRRDRDLRGMVVKSGAKDAILLDVTEDKMPDIALARYDRRRIRRRRRSRFGRQRVL